MPGCVNARSSRGCWPLDRDAGGRSCWSSVYIGSVRPRRRGPCLAVVASAVLVSFPAPDGAASRVELNPLLNSFGIAAFVHRGDGAFAKMERVAEALQFAVIVEGARTISLEAEVLHEIDFLVGGAGAHSRIAKEIPKARFCAHARVRFDFPIAKLHDSCGHQAPIQCDLQRKGFQVD